MSCRIHRLDPRDCLRMDAEPLLRLQATDGEQGVRLAVNRAREELALRLDLIAGHFAAGLIHELVVELRGLAALAQPIGLTDLARVAHHVAANTIDGDDAALAATYARLTRLGASALTLIGASSAPVAGA